MFGTTSAGGYNDGSWQFIRVFRDANVATLEDGTGRSVINLEYGKLFNMKFYKLSIRVSSLKQWRPTLNLWSLFKHDIHCIFKLISQECISVNFIPML